MTLLRMLAFTPGERIVAAQAAQAPARAAAQRPAAAPAPESKKNPGDPGWEALVQGLSLSGMTRMLAQHCELVARTPDRIELKIAQAHQRLLDGPYQERLKTALEQHFGGKLRLVIKVTESATSSPAAVADREKQQRQVQATTAIEQDPFVRELVENFDGHIVESTIKPVQ